MHIKNYLFLYLFLFLGSNLIGQKKKTGKKGMLKTETMPSPMGIRVEPRIADDLKVSTASYAMHFFDWVEVYCSIYKLNYHSFVSKVLLTWKS